MLCLTLTFMIGPRRFDPRFRRFATGYKTADPRAGPRAILVGETGEYRFLAFIFYSNYYPTGNSYITLYHPSTLCQLEHYGQ